MTVIDYMQITFLSHLHIRFKIINYFYTPVICSLFWIACAVTTENDEMTSLCFPVLRVNEKQKQTKEPVHSEFTGNGKALK